jgi:hypothetical protein
MSSKNPSSRRLSKNPSVDPKRVTIVRKRSEPPPEIMVIQKIGGKTIISNVNGTITAEVENYNADRRFLQEA